MARLILFCWFCVCLAAPIQAETLKFWQFWPEDWLKPELSKFEAQTGIKVEVERLTWGDGLNKIITALAAGEGPDVIEIGSTWVAGFSSGLTALETSGIKEQLNGWAPALYQGNTYAYPWTLSTGALYVNLDLLKKVGEPVPVDWASLLRASQKIQALGPEIYGYGIKTGSYSTWQKFLPFAWSNQARVIDEKGAIGVGKPEFIKAVSFYKELKDAGLFDDNQVVRKFFETGRLGFMLDEPGQVKRLHEGHPELHFQVIKLPPPKTSGQSMAFLGGQMLAVPKSTKHPEAAQKLIRFLIKPEAASAITSRITTLFPAQKGASELPFYWDQHPELLVFLESLNHSTAPPAHPQWVQIQEVFSEALERTLYGLDSPEVAMATAQAQIEILIKPKPRGERPTVDHWMLLVRYGGLALLSVSILWLIWAMVSFLKLNGSKRSQAKKKWRYRRDTFVFLGPWLAVFGVFSLYPIMHSVYLSFTDFRATDMGPPAWIGIDNYIQLASDPHYLNSLTNSLWFVLGTVPVILILAVVLAVVLNQKLRFKNFYRAAYFMPVVASVMVIATLFVEVYSPVGLLNDLLSFVGLSGHHWLKEPDWALIGVMGMNIWASFGFYCVMVLAGLQNIPQEYYEASSLEGAGKLRQFFGITLPLLKPTLLVVVVMDSILAFQVFGEILLMTKGGPLRTTETAVYYLYDLAFHKQEMGYGSAAAYGIFAILLCFTSLQWAAYARKAKS